ncbi:MAG: 4Fe-4S cluster-binding domain-containing protein [Bacilli bacterium]|jgi:anaerobic ribonucleoside-triphosphate reductase-activating protein
MNMHINSIRYNNSLVDGPGIRTVLFMQGCDIHCPGCQNASTWDINKGKVVDVKDLADELNKNVFNKKITISGGEPLLQKESLLELVKLLEKYEFDIAVYTGHQKEEVPEELIKHIKYLKTGNFIKDLKTTVKAYVGSINQEFEEVKE